MFRNQAELQQAQMKPLSYLQSFLAITFHEPKINKSLNATMKEDGLTTSNIIRERY